MSMTLDAPAATGTRIAELTRDGITLRLSVTDGQPWIALERDDGRCVGMPLNEETRIWLSTGLAEMESGFGLDCWMELEP